MEESDKAEENHLHLNAKYIQLHTLRNQNYAQISKITLKEKGL